jgi:alpha-tubulin suppressor-like RCC1 family protein
MVHETLQLRSRPIVSWVQNASLVLLCCAAAACLDKYDDDGDSAVPPDGADAAEDAGDAEDAADGEEPDAGEPDGDEPDADEPDGSGPDGSIGDDSSAPDAASPSTQGKPCDLAAACDDGVYCNGIERCDVGSTPGVKVCLPAVRVPCSPKHACREATRDCDCATPDADGDGYAAKECPGGTDCDDSTDACHPGLPETCDDQFFERDEDCNATTFGAKDSDGDGQVDSRCRNYDVDHDKWRGGDDCDDHNPFRKREGLEICDYFDNNCNGWVDERPLPDPADPNKYVYEEKNGGQMIPYLPDFDRDGHGKAGAVPLMACPHTEPPGYIEYDEAPGLPSKLDCDDTKPDVYIGADELCDGRDNNCNQAVDDNVVGLPEFTDTDVQCVNGSPAILSCPTDTRYCAGDPIERGCSTDETRLSTCRSCSSKCQLSCGKQSCDEIVELAAGGHQTCGVTKEGRVACWGRGADGRLGNDSTALSTRPVWAIRLDDARAIAVGFNHACAVNGPDRALWCWGSNEAGRLGRLELDAFIPAPVQVRGLSNQSLLTGVRQVAAGLWNTCAVLDDGTLACFGSAQNQGLIANNNAAGTYTATRAVRSVYDPDEEDYLLYDVQNVRQVALGQAHGCALLTDGTVECWGSNQYGQLGDNRATPLALTLQPVPGLANVSSLSAGSFHTCAIAEGAVHCWGDGRLGQLGRAPGTDEARPGRVAGLSAIERIVAGADSTCAIGPASGLVCWGANDLGQLGRAQPRQSHAPLPVPVEGISKLAASAGRWHYCAQRADASMVCWGVNDFGQLGNGTTIPQAGPVSVASALGEH